MCLIPYRIDTMTKYMLGNGRIILLEDVVDIYNKGMRPNKVRDWDTYFIKVRGWLWNETIQVSQRDFLTIGHTLNPQLFLFNYYG